MRKRYKSTFIISNLHIKLFLDLDKFYEFKRSLKIQDKLFYGLNSGTEKEFKQDEI